MTFIAVRQMIKSMPREFEASLLSALLPAVVKFLPDPTRDATNLKNKQTKKIKKCSI